MDQNRPKKFDSLTAEVNWENSTLDKAQKLREKIESGEFLPSEAQTKLEAKNNFDGDCGINKNKQVALRQEKVSWLKLEQRLVEVDLALKKALHHQHPDLTSALGLLQELHQITVGSFIVKKQPQIVETVRKIRKYVGPKNYSPSDIEDKVLIMEKIRLKADSVYVKIKSSFALSDDSGLFESLMAEKVDFDEACKEMERIDGSNKKQKRTKK